MLHSCKLQKICVLTVMQGGDLSKQVSAIACCEFIHADKTVQACQ